MIALVDETGAVAELLAGVRRGDRRALARAISLVEDQGPGAAQLLSLCAPYRGCALILGITGPPGAGKSTLVDQMVRLLRTDGPAEGRSVGVVAVDPTSPFTGGALLGDRIRMNGFAADEGVTIRSLASRGARGGLAAAAGGTCALMAAAGFEVILLETMGVGQDEMDVAGLADLTLLVLVPGMGDDVQTLKAGIMEAADIYVINKADREGAERLCAEIEAMQHLGAAGGLAPVLATVAITGAGVAELWAEIEGRRQTGTTRRWPAAGQLLTQIPFGNEKGESGEGRGDKGVRLLRAGDSSLRLDHIGIAVREIAPARSFYEALGMVVSSEEAVEHEQVKTAFLHLGESRLELLEATAADSTIGRFLDRRGEGLHHIAIHADDLDGKFAELRASGVRLVNDAIQVGAGGHRYFFVHPASTGGVLVEIVGDSEAAPARRVVKGRVSCD